MTAISLDARLAALDALCSQFDGGQVLLYVGTRSATPDIIATATLVATFDLPSPAFEPASAGDGTDAATDSAAAYLDVTTPIEAVSAEALDVSSDEVWVRVIDSTTATLMDANCGDFEGYTAWWISPTTITPGDTVTLMRALVSWDAGEV